MRKNTSASKLPARMRMSALILACSALTASPVLAQEIVKIGYSGPLSGGAAQYGKNVLDGALMAINEVNATNPEIAGKKVKFEMVSLDDKYSPSETAINAQRLVQQHKTAAILVPHSGGIFALQTTNEAQKYLLLAYSSVPQITNRGNKLTLRIPPEFTTYIKPFSAYLMTRYGKKIALIGADHDYAKAWVAAFKPAWEAAGGTVVAENAMSYNRATDFYSGVSKALAAKPDVLFVGGASEPTGLVVKQARELGFKGGFFVIDQAKLDEMAKVTGGYGALEGAIGVLPVVEDPAPEMKDFVVRFHKIYPNRDPGSEVVWNYTAIHATLQAMKLAGTSSDATAIRAQLENGYKALTSAQNPGGVKSIDANGGTVTTERAGAVENSKVKVIATQSTK
jgi:branched-chain amino acid transport system substrate-binding protein